MGESPATRRGNQEPAALPSLDVLANLADLQSLGQRRHLGQKSHWIGTVAVTTVPRFAVASSISTLSVGFLRLRTGVPDPE